MMKISTILFISLLFDFSLSFSQNKITLEDIFLKGTFSEKSAAGFTPLKDGQHYVQEQPDEKGNTNYFVYDFKTGNVTDTLVKGATLIPPGSHSPIVPENFSLSSDESKILFSTESEKIYRHSSMSNYWIYDLKTKMLTQVSKNGKQQVATISPDGNQCAFVRDNNLFITDLSSGNEKQITSDGKHNFIINGVCDWVYEEEFSFTQAYQWSPDGKSIAFYHFDESAVPEYTVQFFTGLYPENYTYKYPKVGQKNSTVSILIYHLDSKKITTVDVGSDTDQYIPRIKWTQDPNQLCVFRMNRWQNHLELLLADAASGKTRVMFTEENKRYIDIHDNLEFFSQNKNFLWTSDINGYNHIYIGNVSDGKLTQVTQGNWDVTACYGLDEKKKLIYYQSAEVSPLERYVYSISFDGQKKTQLTFDKGWNDADFNPSRTFMMVTHSDANSFHDYKLYDANGKFIRTLEDNHELKDKLKSYSLSQKQFFTFKTVDGTILNGWMMMPQDFDSTKKYPVFMTEYGGPGSQEVMNSGSPDMFQEYLTQQGYVVACIDNRGTGARGEEFKKMTYLHLGEFEPIDQIAGAKYLGSLSFVDKTRICIFGWSYGGYLSSLCIELGNDVFKSAIAVAPVTDWRFYDSIYTERYMRDEKQNKSGYDEGAPLTYADKIKGNFLLIAGLSDDNVHYQNTADFMKKLYASNVKFDQMTFPDKNHSIYGGNTRYYLFSRIADWLKEND
ncbi:MAG: S9 family peptidase [Chitinophagales bacterium]